MQNCNQMIRRRCINNDGTAECAAAHRIHDSSHQSINVPPLIGLIGDCFPSLQLKPLPTWCQAGRRRPRERPCSSAGPDRTGRRAPAHTHTPTHTSNTQFSSTDLSVSGRTQNVSDPQCARCLNKQDELSSVRPTDERHSTRNSRA